MSSPSSRILARSGEYAYYDATPRAPAIREAPMEEPGDASTYLLPEAEVKGRLASLLNSSFDKIHELKQELAVERLKNTYGSGPGASPVGFAGKEVYISPRHHVPATQSHHDTVGRLFDSPRKVHDRLGPFGADGERLISSVAALAGSHSGAGASSVLRRPSGIASDQTFSQAEQRNMRQATARSKQTTDRLRESLASLQHEKSKLELQSNHLKSKLAAANDKSIHFERRLLELENQVVAMSSTVHEKNEAIAAAESRCQMESVKVTQLEEDQRRLKHENDALQFLNNTRKAQMDRVNKTLEDEKLAKKQLGTKLADELEKEEKLQAQSDRLQQHEARLKEQTEAMKKTIEELNKKLLQLSGDHETVEGQLQRAKGELKNYEAVVAAAEKKLAAQETQAAEQAVQAQRTEGNLLEQIRQFKSDREKSLAQIEMMENAAYQAKEDLAEQRGLVGQLKTQLADSKSSVTKLDLELNTTKDELRRMSDAKHRFESRCRGLEDDLAAAESKLITTQQNLDQILVKADALQREAAKGQEELVSVRGKAYHNEDALKRVEAQLKSRTEAVEKERAETASLRKARLELEMALERSKRGKEAADKQVSSLEQRLHGAQLDEQMAQDALAELKDKHVKLGEDLSRGTQQYEDARRECMAKDTELLRLNDTVIKLQATSAHQEMEFSAKLTEAEERYRALESTVEALRDTAAKYEEEKKSRRYSKISKGRRGSVLSSSASAAAEKAAVNNAIEEEKMERMLAEHLKNTQPRKRIMTVDEDTRLRGLHKGHSRGASQQQSPMMVKFEKESIFRTLSQSSAFKDIEVQALQDLINGATIFNFSRDQYIIKQGETGARMYIIASGKVEITRSQLKTVNGQTQEVEQMLINRGLGQFFGEFAMVADTVRTANVVTRSDSVKVLGVDRSLYDKLNEDHGNCFEAAFAPHRVGAHQDVIRVPRKRGFSVAGQKSNSLVGPSSSLHESIVEQDGDVVEDEAF